MLRGRALLSLLLLPRSTESEQARCAEQARRTERLLLRSPPPSARDWVAAEQVRRRSRRAGPAGRRGRAAAGVCVHTACSPHEPPASSGLARAAGSDLHAHTQARMPLPQDPACARAARPLLEQLLLEGEAAAGGSSEANVIGAWGELCQALVPQLARAWRSTARCSDDGLLSVSSGRWDLQGRTRSRAHSRAHSRRRSSAGPGQQCPTHADRCAAADRHLRSSSRRR